MVVTADPSQCSFQFKATGTEKFVTPCDVIKSTLVNLSVNYENVSAPAGTAASVKIGDASLDAAAATPAAITAAVKAHGYPAGADPAEINYPMTILLLAILVFYVTMVYLSLIHIFAARSTASSFRFDGLPACRGSRRVATSRPAWIHAMRNRAGRHES